MQFGEMRRIACSILIVLMSKIRASVGETWLWEVNARRLPRPLQDVSRVGRLRGIAPPGSYTEVAPGLRTWQPHRCERFGTCDGRYIRRSLPVSGESNPRLAGCREGVIRRLYPGPSGRPRLAGNPGLRPGLRSGRPFGPEEVSVMSAQYNWRGTIPRCWNRFSSTTLRTR